jgi:hypothetical protein
LIKSGLESVLAAIEAGMTEKYPLEGGRESVAKVMEQAAKALAAEAPRVRLKPWRGRDFQELFTVGTRVTVSLELKFQVEGRDCLPKGIARPDGRFALTLLTQVKLSARGHKDLPSRDTWTQFLRARVIDVPGLGRHELEGDRWFRHSKPVEGSQDEIARQVADSGKAILAALSSYLDDGMKGGSPLGAGDSGGRPTA